MKLSSIISFSVDRNVSGKKDDPRGRELRYEKDIPNHTESNNGEQDSIPEMDALSEYG